MKGLVDGLIDSWDEHGSPLTYTILLHEEGYGPDAAWLEREGFLSETPTSHDTWMEAAGLLDT